MTTQEAAADALTVACPVDGALNRVPSGRLAQHPKCGKCGAQLFQGKPAILVAANFDRHAVKSDLPLLVDFWAEWCGPCRMMAPAFDEAAGRLEPRIRLGKLDTEAEPAIAARYGIQGIPTMALIHKGREVARISGAMPASSIVRWAEQALGGL